MRSIRFIYFGIVSFLLVIFIGCSNSTNSPITVSIPGVGSSFIFHHYDVDSASRMIDSTSAFDTITITGRELSYMGKTHVLQITSAKGNVLYVNVESNGDYSEYVQSRGKPGGQSGWFTISMSPNSKSAFLLYDTLQFGIRDTTIVVFTYLRSRTQMLAGANFHVIDFDVSEYGAGVPDGVSYGPTTQWYSPDVALIVGTDQPPYHLNNGHGWNPGYHSEVISFHLQ